MADRELPFHLMSLFKTKRNSLVRKHEVFPENLNEKLDRKMEMGGR